jgi:hypothetical protein
MCVEDGTTRTELIRNHFPHLYLRRSISLNVGYVVIWDCLWLCTEVWPDRKLAWPFIVWVMCLMKIRGKEDECVLHDVLWLYRQAHRLKFQINVEILGALIFFCLIRWNLPPLWLMWVQSHLTWSNTRTKPLSEEACMLACWGSLENFPCFVPGDPF